VVVDVQQVAGRVRRNEALAFEHQHKWIDVFDELNVSKKETK
jgi:hypothetical protein